MRGFDCAGVFPSFVFILCNACFCSPPINRSMSSRLFGFERLDFVSALFLEIFCVFCVCIIVMLGLQDEGSSKETCMVCVLPFHQNPNANRDPTFLKPINRSAG